MRCLSTLKPPSSPPCSTASPLPLFCITVSSFSDMCLLLRLTKNTNSMGQDGHKPCEPPLSLPPIPMPTPRGLANCKLHHELDFTHVRLSSDKCLSTFPTLEHPPYVNP
eukprot:EG_transcript_57744